MLSGLGAHRRMHPAGKVDLIVHNPYLCIQLSFDDPGHTASIRSGPGSLHSSRRFGAWLLGTTVAHHIIRKLVAMDLPGPGTVFLNQSWQFTAPVFIADTITATAEVIEVHACKPVARLKVQVVRQTGEEVLDGEAWCYTLSNDSPS